MGMEVFPLLEDAGFEQVVFCSDRRTQLRAIIAVHSTALGPALGGTRFLPYATEGEALTDVLHLARGMTYKCAAAGLDFGGGKAVIIGDPARDKTEPLLRAYGRFVDTLGGRFVTAEDVGTTAADMELLRRETRHAVGVGEAYGGLGDPSPATARGVLRAMQAVAVELWASPGLAGRSVVIAGVGKVGSQLARLLVEEGAIVTVADPDPRAVERLGGLPVAVVPAATAHRVPCDFFSPCALGGILNEATVSEFACRAVVGSANNQLAEPGMAKALQDAGVLYAPDYIVNAGGVISVASELQGYHRDLVLEVVDRIFDTTGAVLATARQDAITTVEAADRLAERRIAALTALPAAATSRLTDG
jgi:glutamate dehydrogenase/leucine dehydrogenase